ncbi:MAG: hypothetical protein JNL58_20095 [Planctomyces sp.]|nr:hypothetical protein [Planctomyces sp.]
MNSPVQPTFVEAPVKTAGSGGSAESLIGYFDRHKPTLVSLLDLTPPIADSQTQVLKAEIRLLTVVEKTEEIELRFEIPWTAFFPCSDIHRSGKFERILRGTQQLNGWWFAPQQVDEERSPVDEL